MVQPCWAEEAPVPKQDWTLFVDIDSFAYSEPYTINGILHDLDGGYRSGDTAVTFNRVETGAGYGNWRFSVFERYDYFLEFTPDFAKLYYLLERDLPLDPSTQYVVDLSAHHLRASGIGLSYQWQVNDPLWIRPRINLLHGSELVHGSLNGEVTTTDHDTYSSTAALDYYYTKDQLFDRQVDSLRGQGASLDLDAGWQVRPDILFELHLEDVISRIWWNEAPYTVAAGDTDTMAVTDEGFLETRSLVSGVESYRDFRQRLPVHGRINGSYQMQPGRTLLAELYFVEDIVFPRLGYQYQLNNSDLIMSAQYDFKANAVGVGLDFRQFSLSLMADNWNLKQAHTLGVQFSYSYQF